MLVQNPGYILSILKGNVVGYFITKVAKYSLSQLYEYSYEFNSKTDFINYIDENTAKEVVFYNDCMDAYAKNSYYMIKIPYSLPKFKINLI